MAIGKYSRSKLEAIIKSVHSTIPETQSEGDTDPGGSDTHIQYNNGGSFGGVSSLLYDDGTGHLTIPDDKRLYFGTNSESFIEYAEGSGDFLTISGSSNGIVLSGSTIQIRGTLEGASPLKIAGGIQIVASTRDPSATTQMKFGDDIKTFWGDDEDTYLQYQTTNEQYMVLSGSSRGIALSGSAVVIDGVLGIGSGMSATSITHAITLPEVNSNAGKIKAVAYTTYSSVRYKDNIQPIENPLGTLKKLKGVTFNWKKNNTPDIGFVAEEVGRHLPEIVDWETDTQYAQSMDYSKIVPLLVESIKSQQKQIDKLHAEIQSLKKI